MAPHSAAHAGAAQATVPQSGFVRALFHVTASADPGVLPRLIEPLAKLGHTPTRVHASCEAGDGSEMSVDLRVAHLARAAAERVAGNLRAVVGVRAVIAVFEDEG